MLEPRGQGLTTWLAGTHKHLGWGLASCCTVLLLLVSSWRTETGLSSFVLSHFCAFPSSSFPSSEKSLGWQGEGELGNLLFSLLTIYESLWSLFLNAAGSAHHRIKTWDHCVPLCTNHSFLAHMLYKLIVLAEHNNLTKVILLQRAFK